MRSLLSPFLVTMNYTVVIHESTEYRALDHIYAVAADGRVLRRLKPYTPPVRPDGYLSCGRQKLLHRVIATTWLEKPEGATHVHHKNGNKADNRAENLEWVTPKKHMSEYHAHSGNYERTEETRAKLRAYRLGKKTSEETKRKQREASLRLGSKPPKRPVGTKCSAESVQKMRDNSAKNTACEVYGVKYRSYAEAARALGMRLHTLRKRCLSDRFTDYKKGA